MTRPQTLHDLAADLHSVALNVADLAAIVNPPAEVLSSLKGSVAACVTCLESAHTWLCHYDGPAVHPRALDVAAASVGGAKAGAA